MKYRNAKFIDEIGNIECEIEHPVYGWIPYALILDDPDTTTNNSKLLEAMTEANDVAAFVPPSAEELFEMAAFDVRAERDFKLATEVDPIAGNALRWAALSPEQQQAWAAYRQTLLDVPEQEGFPHNVVWPIKPE